MVPAVKQHVLPAASTPKMEYGSPGGFDQRAMTTACLNNLTQYLSINCFLKASSHLSVLTGVLPALAVTADVYVSAAMISGRVVSIPRLGALLDRVSALCGGRSLTRLDPSDLVDLDLGLTGVLNVDVHQGRVERHWRRREPDK